MRNPSESMLEMLLGYRVSQVVRAYAYYDIADKLHERELEAEALSLEAGANLDAVARLLKAGETLGLVMKRVDGRYQSTPVLATLRSGAPGSMKSLVLGFTAQSSWLPWGRFVEAVRTSQPQANEALGCDFFEHFAANVDDRRHFSSAMDAVSREIAEQIVSIETVPRDGTVADIGGASGILVQAFLAKFEDRHGILFELPEVAKNMASRLERSPLADRLSVVGGDFFDSVPPADVYVLKWILHDWDDEKAARILKNCRGSLKDGGTIIIVEMDVEPGGCSVFAGLLDLSMLTLVQGRERTVSEYSDLFAKAGLALRDVYKIPSLVGSFNVMKVSAA